MRFPVLRFGIAPSVDDEAFRDNFERMCKALGYHLGTVVQPRVLASRDVFVSQFSRGQLDLGWLAPSVALDCLDVGVASPHWSMVRCGEVIYYSAIFAKKDGPVRSVSDVKGVRAAWVLPDSASGYLVPLATMRARGVCLADAFREQTFAKTHAAAAQFVIEDKADIGAGFAHFSPGNMQTPVASSWAEAGLEDQLSVLAVAGPIPTDVIAAHRSLKAPYVRELTRAFDWLMTGEQAEAAKVVFSCEGLLPCTQQHLLGLKKLLGLLDPRALARP